MAGYLGAQTMTNCYSESSLYLEGKPETSYIGGIVGAGTNDEDTKLTTCYYLSASATTGVGWLPKVQAEGTEIVATIDVKPASKSQINSAVKNLGLTAS